MANHLGALSCGAGHPLNMLVCPAHSFKTQSDRDLGNVEAGSTTLNSLFAKPGSGSLGVLVSFYCFPYFQQFVQLFYRIEPDSLSLCSPQT